MGIIRLMNTPNTYKSGPDEFGHFGIFGGRYVAETLMPLILEVEQAYAAAKVDVNFQAELDQFLSHYVGRPSPLYFAERLTDYFGGPNVPPMYLRGLKAAHILLVMI